MYPVRKFNVAEAACSTNLRLKMQEAEHMVRCIAPSRERSLALTKLDEALFWANAAIATGGIGAKTNTTDPMKKEAVGNGTDVVIPKETRADLSFDVYDVIRTAMSNAIDDFVCETLNSAYPKSE